VQVLDSTDLQSYSNEEGHFIRGHLIDTRLNGNNWRIKPSIQRLTEILNREVPEKDFMIDGEKILEGKDAHYYGNDTEVDILRGYAAKSHGKYKQVLGPFSYNDGTDDVWYDFIAKLRDSKAASVLMDLGSKTWIKFAHSPHIMPIEGPDNLITDFHFLGGALVDRGAYGPDAVISKMCKGTAPVCNKSLAAAADDIRTAEIITSLVSKAASFQPSMSETITNAVSNAPPVAELKPEPSSPPAPVNQISITAEEIQKIKDEAIAKSELVWKEKVTALETKDKINTLKQVFAGIKDTTVQDALIKKYLPQDVELVKQAFDDFNQHFSQEEPKPDADKPSEEPPTSAKKSKAASLELPKEPDVPVQQESKAASLTDNPALTIHNFIMGGRK
jgi:hypothetical protein